MRLSDRNVLLIFVLLVLGGTALIWIPLERHYRDDPAEKASRGEITGLKPGSLLLAANARRAIDAIRSRSDAESRVQSLSLRPTYVAATVVVPADGTEHDFRVDPSFAVDADPPDDASSDDGASFARIDPAAPERMARTVLAQLHRDDADLDYAAMSSSPTDRTITWSLYLKHGRIRDRTWVADAHGGHVKRIGT